MMRLVSACLGLSLPTLALVWGCGQGATPSFVDAGLDAHRIGMCDPDRVRPAGDAPLLGGDCATDSDCVDGVNGRCTLQGPYSWCTYDECFSDADCPEDLRCACGVEKQDGNLCLGDHCGGCTIAECAVSWGCEGHTGRTTGGVQNLECYTPDDSCRTDADCDWYEFCTRGPNDVGPDPPDPSWHCASRSCGP